MRILLRGQPWAVQDQAPLGTRTWFRLQDPETTEVIEALCPPDEFELLAEPAPALDRRSLTPLSVWKSLHDALQIQSPPEGQYAAFVAGRISPEPYQFAPLARLLAGPRRGLLIADDVGLGKTIEAGICLLELMARGVGARILLVIPPGLIPQWLDEMWSKFGLEFQSIENSAALDRVQTRLSEGIQPWAYFDRVITSTEYLKRRDAQAAALARRWDIIVVDEAHYLAESGTPSNPYYTARTRLGPKLRENCRTLLLLTATPHNGYRHSFRSLLELIEPATAALHGRADVIQRRVARSMIRRLKPQVVKSAGGDGIEPAFPIRVPVQRIEVITLSDEEKQVFALVTEYCSKTLRAAADTEAADLVSFAMQIVKKRMLSSRVALHNTVRNRLEALGSRTREEPPTRAELRELQTDMPLTESAAERTANRIIRAAVARDARRRRSEKQQLKAIDAILKRIEDRPDPKILALLDDLERDVLSIPGEKAIVFTEYRDTLAALRGAFGDRPQWRNAFVELTGGLSPRQRQQRIASFHTPECRVLLATDAASEGLNLQRHCCRLYHFELPWNPNRLEQRNGRIDRHGQTRPPVIRYLFYPASPEDRVLDRLVQRIATMHDDRVSTPDILGMLESSRIEDVLGGIESVEDTERRGESLMRLFDARQEEIGREIAPFVLAGVQDDSPMPYANTVSADPMLTDDMEFERIMLEILGQHASEASLAGTYRIDVPRHLQGPGVEAHYRCATFRRSLATQHPADEVEFIHRLHPLSRALGAHAIRELTIEPARNAFASRIAVLRHVSAKQRPLVLFTFLGRPNHTAGKVFGVAVDIEGVVLGASVAESLLTEAPEGSSNVPWPECEKIFGARFAALQSKAAQEAAVYARSNWEATMGQRAQVANILKEEAELYRVDRLKEIDVEERVERAGTREQMEMFRTPGINWGARRAAVETHYAQRVRDIDEFADVPPPAEPQPLGVLLVLPPD